MTSGTTRLHIDLSHIPQFCGSSKFNFCKTSNNSNRPAPYPSNNLLVKSKTKSVCQMQTRSDSFYNDIPTPVRSSTACLQTVHPGANPTHPYLRDGWSARRKPKKIYTSSCKQPPSQIPENSADAYLPQLKVTFSRDEENPGLTIKQRKQLLMTSIPHSRRSITPNEDSIERSDPQERRLPASYKVPVSAESDSDEEKGNSLVPIALISPIENETAHTSVGDTDSKKRTQSPTAEELPTRPKLALSRRCSEATLPLTFAYEMAKKNYKKVKKPRSKTYDVIPETDEISSGNTLNCQRATDSDLFNKSEVLFIPSQDLFMSSRMLKPRHSVYIYHSPKNFDNPPEQTDFKPQLSFNKISADRPMFGIHLESSQQNYSNNSVDRNLSHELVPVLAHQNTGSFLSDTSGSLTEESSPGNPKSNNHSENYSNTLDSQECINVSSSTEDIVGTNLSDSGYHFDQQAKHFSAQPVKKVILDLSQQKYVGLSLVGGADSPFGNLPVLVKEIMPGGAAERCDISRGDEILGINSFSLENKPLQFAVERLRHCSSRDDEIILWIIPQLDSS